MMIVIGNDRTIGQDHGDRDSIAFTQELMAMGFLTHHIAGNNIGVIFRYVA